LLTGHPVFTVEKYTQVGSRSRFPLHRAFWKTVISHICSIQCFDNVGWVTGMVKICATFPLVFSSGTSGARTPRSNGEPANCSRLEKAVKAEVMVMASICCCLWEFYVCGKLRRRSRRHFSNVIYCWATGVGDLVEYGVPSFNSQPPRVGPAAVE